MCLFAILGFLIYVQPCSASSGVAPGPLPSDHALPACRWDPVCEGSPRTRPLTWLLRPGSCLLFMNSCRALAVTRKANHFGSIFEQAGVVLLGHQLLFPTSGVQSSSQSSWFALTLAPILLSLRHFRGVRHSWPNFPISFEN